VDITAFKYSTQLSVTIQFSKNGLLLHQCWNLDVD